MAPKKTNKRSTGQNENKRIISNSIKKQEAEAVQAILKNNKPRKVAVTKAIFKNARRTKNIRPIVISDDDDEQEHNVHMTNNMPGRNFRQVRSCKRFMILHGEVKLKSI
jgi:hypothetical protein